MFRETIKQYLNSNDLIVANQLIAKSSYVILSSIYAAYCLESSSK